jgi:hypothetical protein
VKLCGNQIYGAFVLNRRVDLHAIDATPARRRGDVCSSPLDGASAATSSHPTHWLIVTQVWGVLFFFVIIIVLCRYAYEFVSRKRQQARERANGPIPVPPPNVNQEAAIARANLSWEVEREQYFTIWGFHLFWTVWE